MTEKMQMRTLASLISEGKKVAFISGNREPNSKNISSKQDSLKEFKFNIVPLMYIKGEKAVKDGCTLVDADTRTIVAEDDATKYIVIIDGQHRYKAAICENISTENLILFEDYTEANTKKLLAAANVECNPWDASDFIKGSMLLNSGNDIAKFANELSEQGYPITTIGKIMCFDSGKLGKSQFAKIMRHEPITVKGIDIERAKRFLKAVKDSHFNDDFVKSRYLINAVITLKGKGEEKVIQMITKLSREIVNEIQNANSDNKSVLLETALKKLLDA